MPRSVDSRRARELAVIVQRLHRAASFRNVLREAARRNVIKDNKTLRRHLDLLILARVLKVRTRDVGSVRQQQLYSLNARKPRVSVGLAALRTHGLSWDVPERETRTVATDFDGLSRSKILDSFLVASLEDCLVRELYVDAKKNTGAVSFVIALASTRRLDLPYFVRRADEMHIGKAARRLLKRILKVVSSRETEVSASVFLAVRARFLRIARQYAQSGFWKLVDEKGVGKLGVRMVENLTEADIIMSAGKQLGVTG